MRCALQSPIRIVTPNCAHYHQLNNLLTSKMSSIGTVYNQSCDIPYCDLSPPLLGISSVNRSLNSVDHMQSKSRLYSALLLNTLKCPCIKNTYKMTIKNQLSL